MFDELKLVGRFLDAMEVYHGNRKNDALWYYDWQEVAIAFGKWTVRHNNELLNAETARRRDVYRQTIRG